MSTNSCQEWSEWLAQAKARVDEHLGAKYDEDVATFHGPTYRRGKKGREDLENAALEWVSVMKGPLALAHPTCRVTSSHIGPPQERAYALQLAMNRLARQLNDKRTIKRTIPDYALRWFVLCTSPEPRDPSKPDGVWWPMIRRVDPKHYIPDMDALDPSEMSRGAHLRIRPRDAVLREAESDKTWNKKLVKAMPAVRAKSRKKGEQFLNDDLIAYFEAWDSGAETGEPMIYTVPWDYAGDSPDDSEFPREPLEYFGPTWGPYSMAGMDVVPSEVAPLSAINGSRLQDDDLNRIRRKIAIAAAKYRKYTATNDPEMAELMKSAEDDGVYVTKHQDIRQAVQQGEHFGSSQYQHLYYDFAKAGRDRSLGIPDLARGQISQLDPTATEAQLASGYTNSMFAGAVDPFREGWKQAWMTRLFYLDADERSEVHLSHAKKRFLTYDKKKKRFDRSNEITLRGGHDKDLHDLFGKFEDLDLELDVFSTSRTGEQKAMAELQALQWGVATLPVAMQSPFALWEKIYDRVGQAWGVEDLEALFDFEKMREVWAMTAGKALGDLEGKPESQGRLKADQAGGGADGRLTSTQSPENRVSMGLQPPGQGLTPSGQGGSIQGNGASGLRGSRGSAARARPAGPRRPGGSGSA